MTRIQFRQNGKHFIAVFTGHSDAERKDGNDLVCAAASMLSQTLVQGVCDAYSRGHLSNIQCNEINEKDGAVSVDVLSTDEGLPYVMGAFSAIAAGCALLAAKYPKNVSLGRNFQSFSL